MIEPVISADPGIMRPLVELEEAENSVYMISQNDFMFTVKYRCIDTGLRDVRVTLGFETDAVLEFNYKKACRKPKAYVIRQGLSSFTMIIGGLGFSIGVYVLYRVARKSK